MINQPRAPYTALVIPGVTIYAIAADSPNNNFDEKKPFKYWIDAHPVAATEIPGYGKLAKYSSYRIGSTRLPERFDYFVRMDEAQVTNIPTLNWTGQKSNYSEVAVPTRLIEVGETLIVDNFGGLLVQNNALWAALLGQSETSASGFTSADRDMLRKIFSAPDNHLFDPHDYTEQLNRIEALLQKIAIRFSLF